MAEWETFIEGTDGVIHELRTTLLQLRSEGWPFCQPCGSSRDHLHRSTHYYPSFAAQTPSQSLWSSGRALWPRRTHWEPPCGWRCPQ